MSHERRALFIFALIAAGLFGIVVRTHGSIDSQILLAFRHPGDLAPIGGRTGLDIVLSITALGSSTLLILFTVIADFYLLLQRRFRKAAVASAAYLGAEFFSQLLKYLVHRPRPRLVPHEMQVSGASFPSGHAMISAAVYLTFAMLLARSSPSPKVRTFLLATGFLLTVLVGLSRLYLGVHWPTDVLAGWVFGATWAFLVSFADKER